MKITFKHVEVFVEIAKTGNMTQAANALHLTQSACSMALSAFEDRLGGAVFDRRGKKLVLNERGREVLPEAVNILLQIAELQDLLPQMQTGLLTGRLTVGASTTVGSYLLPKIIANFATVNPKAKVTTAIANTQAIIEKLLKFEIDIGIVEGHCYEDEFEIIPWRKDQLVFIAAADHVLAKQKKITVDDLQQAQWILRELGSGTREIFEEAMQGKANLFLEFNQTEAIKQAVLAGFGISCISKIAVADLLATGQLVELKTSGLELTRDFYILLRKGRHKTKVLEHFIAALET